MAGRPRTVSDERLLRATAEVVGRDGPARTTLAAVAAEAGVVPATLVQRFGSKRGMLLALAELSLGVAERALERARAEHETALDALTSLVVDSMADLGDPERYANHLAFLCMDLTDPQFHAGALSVHDANGDAVAALLGDAAARGELRPGTDPRRLGALVRAVVDGTGLAWALDRRGTLPDRLRAALTDLLVPYLEKP